MLAMRATPAESNDSDDATDLDLIPAYKAAAIAACSASTLRRWAGQGRIRQYQRDGFSGYFYVREECEAERAKFRRVS